MADQSIAVLNAIQITAKPTIMPPGEKLGSFEVSPNGSSSASPSNAMGPGAPGGSAAGTTSAGAGKSDKADKNGTGGAGKSVGKAGLGAGSNGAGNGSSKTGGGAGSGKGSAGKGAGTSGKGVGNGSAGTKGGGSGSGNGPGAGAGTGEGAGPFSDIEVIGGVGSGMQGAGVKAAVKTSVPRGYDFNIVASGGSGGGLRDFGIFHNEAVMRHREPRNSAWMARPLRHNPC
jgi:hypothetical protein